MDNFLKAIKIKFIISRVVKSVINERISMIEAGSTFNHFLGEIRHKDECEERNRIFITTNFPQDIQYDEEISSLARDEKSA